MTHRKKITSQSGFMSVEAIATTLFYLIMVAVIAAIAAQVISGGKIASTLNSLGALRVNVQYVGANLSDYSTVNSSDPALKFNLHEYVPSISNPASEEYRLPTAHLVTTFPAKQNDINPDTGTAITSATGDTSLFTIQIVGLSPSDCRKVAYYAIGGGYGLATTTATTSAPANGDAQITSAEVESKCGTGAAVSLHLTSK